MCAGASAFESRVSLSFPSNAWQSQGGSLNRTAALVAQNDYELSAQVIDRILDAGEDMIVEDVARDADDE